MSPVKKKERVSPIDRERFKAALKGSKYSQRELAEMLFTTEAYLSRRLKIGNIDRNWFDKICEWLDINPDYLSGNSDFLCTWVAWKRKKIDGKDCIRAFMMSRGFDKSFTDALTPDNLDDIEIFIISLIRNGKSPLDTAAYNMDVLSDRIHELEHKVDELEINANISKK